MHFSLLEIMHGEEAGDGPIGSRGMQNLLGVKVKILFLFYKPCYVPLKFWRPIKKSDPHKAHLPKVELVGSSLIIICRIHW